MTRPGPKYNPDPNVDVPPRYAEFAYEYRIGYDDGRRKKAYALAPGFDYKHWERKEAYDAGKRRARRERGLT